MAIPHIRHLAIRTRDVQRSVEFYRDGLGFQEIGPRGIGMDLTDQTLNLTILPFVGTPGPIPEEGQEQIHFGIFVPDAKAIFLRLREKGVLSVRYDIKLRNEPVANEIPEGSFKVVDPDGNIIDVTDNDTEWRGISSVR